MTDRYSELRESLVRAVLSTPGDTEPSLRKAVEAWAAARAGRSDDTVGELPTALVPLVEKVAREAYKTTDDDFAVLKRAGYSEDAILEIVLSAALGAGLTRTEVGLAALRGGRDATRER